LIRLNKLYYFFIDIQYENTELALINLYWLMNDINEVWKRLWESSSLVLTCLLVWFQLA